MRGGSQVIGDYSHRVVLLLWVIQNLAQVMTIVVFLWLVPRYRMVRPVNPPGWVVFVLLLVLVPSIPGHSWYR